MYNSKYFRASLSLLLLCVFVFASLTSAIAQNIPGDVRRILELQDKRTFGDSDELGTLLMSTDSAVRVSAICALGNIADTTSVSKLNFLLAGPFESYPNEADFRAASFALGQMPCAESRQFIRLILEEKASLPSSYSKYFLDALGRIGDSSDLSIASKSAYSADTGITRAAGMSIARFSLRKIRSRESVEALKHLVSTSSDPGTLSNAAFALWRTGDKDLLKSADREIYALTESEDSQIRMWGFNALARLADIKLLMYTLESFLPEDDWRVKVNMLNFLNAFAPDSLTGAEKQINTVLMTALNDKNENVAMTAVEVAKRIYSQLGTSNDKWMKEGAEMMKQVMLNEEKFSSNVRGSAAIAFSQIMKDKSKDDLFALFRSAKDYRLKADVLRAFGSFEDAMIYKQVRDTVTDEVARYNTLNPNTDGRMVGSRELSELYKGFVEMMSSLDNRLDAQNKKTSKLIFMEFAGSKDPMITALSLDALQDSIYAGEREEIASVMKFDFGELNSQDDLLVKLIFIDAFKNLGVKGSAEILKPLVNSGNYEIAYAAADAVEKLTGEKLSPHADKRYDFDWDSIEKCKGKTVTLKTSKGDIDLELFTEVAPFTVQSFVKLATDNFFDSTIFHRVVPNFVIQGGDPTGTGYGGPDYSMRSEFSSLEYEEGTLGMASSGKETEGSQYFITHSRTPHLDGKYTIFGKVLDGMDVVSSISYGDYLYDVVINEK